MGRPVNESLILVDEFWIGRPIDVQVGDLVLLSPGVLLEGAALHFVGECEQGSLYQGKSPGSGRFYDPVTGWASYTRVSRREYSGRSIYRYLEDVDFDE
jgi:hypothetical protein